MRCRSRQDRRRSQRGAKAGQFVGIVGIVWNSIAAGTVPLEDGGKVDSLFAVCIGVVLSIGRWLMRISL
jgi:hypothetical protein